MKKGEFMIKTYKGLEYTIFNNLGTYCGYVKLPDNHPYIKLIHLKKDYTMNFEVGYDDMDIECHGGLTFSRIIKVNNEYLQGFSRGAWIGWDYGHFSDKNKGFTEEKVEQECKNVIEQVLLKQI